MVRYEIKKVFSRTSSKIALLFLAIVLVVISYFVIHEVTFVNGEGNEEHGFAAIRKLKEVKKEWEGELTEEVLRKVIEENGRIASTAESQSKDYQENDIAYGWRQGFSDIRSLMIYSYGDFNTFDYYIVDSLSPDAAKDFYTNRVQVLKIYLAGDGKDLFSEEEKEFLIEKYEQMRTPLYYDYTLGWTQLFQYAPSIIMITVLVLGFLVAGIFSGEFQLKADAVFYSSYHGRDRAISAKVKAGFLIVTAVYWGMVLLYSVIVLGILGTDGAGCMIQAYMGGWKSFYNITNWQEYVIIILGGYIGNLFMAFLTMLVSAKTGSAVVAVMIPFILIFIPSFISGSSISILSKVLGLLPDQLLQMNMAVRYFNLYRIGRKIMGAVGILPVLYGVLTVGMAPVIYGIYKRK